MTRIEKRAEEAAVELLLMTGWMKWHDYFVGKPEGQTAELLQTLEGEVFPAYDVHHILYLEARDDEKVRPAAVSDRKIMGERYIACEFEDRDVSNYPVATYGASWRLWTDAPTDEQRESAAWAD